MKKIVITDTESVEKLYQGFKRKMTKDFKSGVSSDGQGEKMAKWVMKHSNLSLLESAKYASQFLESMMEEN